MKNDQKLNDQLLDEDQLDEEAQPQYSEEERKEIMRRRAKARKQFKSPLFILGIAVLAIILIVPRCTYKENVRKNLERRAQQSEQGVKMNTEQGKISEEEAGMVPKF
jgi:adenylylsulfate kinase-like enzyme